MEKKVYIQLTILSVLFFLSLFLVAGLLLYDVVFVNHQPDYLVRPSASTDLETRVQNLESNLENLQSDLTLQLNNKLFYFGGIALLISFLAAFLGWKTFKDLDGLIREKIRITLENELYQLDPANLTIRLPKFHHDKELMEKRLRAAGLKNLKEYTELSRNCKVGLTIVPIENDEQGQDFVNFLDREQPSVDDAAFVLYASNGYRIAQNVINHHDRAATANMPSTVVTAILAISRGLHRDRAIQSKKEEI